MKAKKTRMFIVVISQMEHTKPQLFSRLFKTLVAQTAIAATAPAATATAKMPLRTAQFQQT